MRTIAYCLVLICFFFATGLRSENAPITTAGNISNATTVPGAAMVPITVKNFVSIGSFTLTLRYKATLATYVSATPHPSFPGMTVVNTVVGTLGKIVITWPQTPGGVTLPDETHLLDLNFTYISSTAALTWLYDNPYVCQYKKYSGGSFVTLSDSPKSSYYINGAISNKSGPVVFAPTITNPAPGSLAVPVTVNNFNSIGAMTLTLEYNQSVLTFVNCTPNAAVSTNFLTGTQVGPNGKMLLTISWFGGATLANGSTLFTVNYTYSNTNGTWSALDWYDNGSSCEFADPLGYALIDSPTADYYKNGMVYTQYAPRVWLPVKTNATTSGTLTLPVLVNSFNNVRSFTLSFEYDPAVMTYGSFTPDAAFGSALTATDAVSGTKRKIVMTWTGTSNVTLPDGSQLGTVNFTYASGASNLAWITSDATSCRFNDANGKAYYDVPKSTYYQDGLIASHPAPRTAAGQLSGTIGQPVTVPLKVYDFTNIGLFAYAIDFDPAVLTYQSAALFPSPGGTFTATTAGLGRILLNWSGTATSLVDASDLINLTFTYNGGASPLAFFDDGNSCRFAENGSGTSLYDSPRPSYYINGYMGPNPLTANFTASATYGDLNTTFTLTDQTTGSPIAWNWVISPSTYYFVNGTSAASQNPQVKFTSNGAYHVTLIASRGTSSSINIKKNYLFVGSHVFLNCPEDQTTSACQSQSAVNTAYANWFASATSTCACNCTLTDNSTGPPSACGGSSTVTWSLSSDCDSPVTCTKTFTVTAAPAVVLTAPAPATEAPCQTQAAIDSKFATWLTSVTYNGGCNLVVTNDAGAAPNACGGSVTVTWTATSSCEANVLRSSTFTVTAAPAVSINCAGDMTVGSCLTQSDINTSYSTWLGTTNFTGGCNAVMTHNSTGAPLTCGGSKIVTWTVTSGCESIKTCSATFTVPSAPAVSITCAADLTVGTCLTQSDINTLYSTWLGTTNFTGGCNAVMTHNSTGAPLACGGSKIVTWTVTSDCESIKTCSATFTVPNAAVVVLTAPTASTEAACQTQAAIDSKFATWLTGVSYSGGCNLVVTNNAGAAPNACGGSVTVTWTATSSCEANVLRNSTFTVTAAPAVSINCAGDMTVGTCLTQSDINTLYSNWLGTTSFTGGCNAVMTHNSTGAPLACGGTKIVTWTVTSDCESIKSCSATFTVPNAPVVVMTAPTASTEAACQTQAAIDSKFATWLTGVSYSGGCNLVVTNNAGAAPNACSGSVTVTWTATSNCEANVLRSSTFTVTAAPAVSINCAADLTVGSCLTQSDINTLYSNWLGTTSFTGGCNAVMTHNSTGAPLACGGTKIVTWTVTSDCESIKTCSATFTVPAAPAVTFTCAIDKTEPAGQAQNAIDASFASWLLTTTASGGCNGSLSTIPATPVAPSANGGSVAVTWTYTSTCAPLTTSCTKTFTVDNAPEVIFTCASDKTEAACQSQTVIDASFAAWLVTTTASGGCNGNLSTIPAVPVAPPACGGSTTVIWNYTSTCGPLHTCTKIFTVNPAPAIIFTCGTDKTEAACQDQAAIDASFASWLLTTSASGGCNGVMSTIPPVPVAPSACGGSAMVTWNYTSGCDVTRSCTRIFTVNNAPGVQFTCAADKTEAACLDQSAIDASFSAWLATFSVSGGCNGILTRTPTTPAPPPACGGYSEVTWTYTSSCDVTKICTRRFTVTAAPAVVFNCPADQSETACQSQAAIDAAFNIWLGTAGASGGCNGSFLRTPAMPVAPPACGGFTDVTWTYASLCDVTKTCTKRFSVTYAPPLELTCAQDHIMATGQPQSVVDAAFTAWLSSPATSGGCNTNITNDGTVAPPATGGSVTVTWNATSSCTPVPASCTATFAVTPTNTISGTLKYYNLQETPMSNVQVRIQKFDTPKVDAIYTTPADGSFSFGNLCAGTYTITPLITKTPGDVNTTDAALVNAWGTTTGTIEYVNFLAGDAADNLWINGTDALKIQLNFVNGVPFDRGPWTWWKSGVTVNSNWDPIIKPTDFNITLNGSDVSNFGLYAMCTGDFNSSFTPGALKGASQTVQMVYPSTRLAGAGEEAALHVRMMHPSTVGAVSLILNYPANLVEIKDVNIDATGGNFAWTSKGNELRISWYSLKPWQSDANDVLLTIQLKTSATFGPGDEIRLKLAASALNELAGEAYRVIPDVVLGMDLLEFSSNGSIEPSQVPALSLESSPNPFVTSTLLNYTLPSEGLVTLEIKDMLGRVVCKPVNEARESGSHTVSLDGVALQPGVYFATVKLHSGGGEMFRTIKLVRNR